MIDTELDDCELTDAELTDAELTALALAADPDQPLDPRAVPLRLHPDAAGGPLPEWYMPPVMAHASVRWQRVMIYAVVAAFLVIDAFGLCITYGQLVAA